MISVNHLYKRFGKNYVLEDINCQLDSGIYGLLGANGAGKTTLMRCITNLYQGTAGNIDINGISVKKRNRINIGYLPQTFSLFKELSVQDCMRYFCNIKGINRKDRNREIDNCLESVNLLNKKETICGKLSGGMIRRVGVAQALLGHPQLILFDEPTAGLDPEERMHFKKILSDLGSEETIIVSTHIVEDIEACCDHVIVMNEGRICFMGTCEELIQCARGKVFRCKKEHVLVGHYFLEKQYEYQGDIFYRVLTSENDSNMEIQEPTLEDGYMCIIKRI